MKTLRPLPARETPLPGESLASLLRRTAEAMGYEHVGRIRQLLADAGKPPPHINHLPPGPLLDRFAQLLRQPSEALCNTTVHHYADRFVLTPATAPTAQLCDSKTILRHFDSAHARFCGSCLGNDKVPYERLVWGVRILPVCVDHGCFLVWRCVGCGSKLRPQRNNVMTCRCGHHVSQSDPPPVSPSVRRLAANVKRWLSGDAVPLPGMSTAACLWWAERLAAAVGKTPSWIGQTRERFEFSQAESPDLVCWIAAADLLMNWSNQAEEFFEAFGHVAKHRTTDTGLGRSFGLLLREAAHLEQLGYATPADTLREYLSQRYTQGHLNGKVCLFQSREHQGLLKRRPWITQTEAAGLLRTRVGAMVGLVDREILVGQIRPAGRRGRSVGLVSRESVEALKGELKTAITVTQAAASLGIGRSRIFALVRAELLPRAVRTAGGWRIPRDSVHALLSLYQRLSNMHERPTNWLSMRQATRQLGPSGLSVVELIRWVQAGRIDARRLLEHDDFKGLLVLRSDVERELPALRAEREQERGYSLSRLAKTLFPERPMKERVLKKWIEAGHLRAARVGRAWNVSPQEVERFRAEYCLSSEACRILGIHRTTLTRREASGLLTPVYGRRVTPGAGFSLYHRTDVLRLKDQRTRAHSPHQGAGSAI